MCLIYGKEILKKSIILLHHQLTNKLSTCQTENINGLYNINKLFNIFEHLSYKRLLMNIINEGQPIPPIDLYEHKPENIVNLADVSKGKKIIIFGVPGAFTPSCSQVHLSGFVNMHDKLKSNGVDFICCVAVNDPYVMEAWGIDRKVAGKVRMLADTNAAFTKALGLTTYLPTLGGIRSKRYSMVVDDGIVSSLQVEPDEQGTGLTCSLAEHVTFAKKVKK